MPQQPLIMTNYLVTMMNSWIFVYLICFNTFNHYYFWYAIISMLGQWEPLFIDSFRPLLDFISVIKFNFRRRESSTLDTDPLVFSDLQHWEITLDYGGFIEVTLNRDQSSSLAYTFSYSLNKCFFWGPTQCNIPC